MDDKEDDDSTKMSLETVDNYQPICEAEQEMASTAQQEFEKGKYRECLTILKKLQSKRPEDLKICHNISVAEYYLSNFKDAEIYLQKNLDICKKANIKIEGLNALDDIDNCVLLYNQGVVLHHLHQFNAAVQVIETMVPCIEPLYETLGKSICFLLCDLYLNVHQQNRLQYLTGYMEKAYFNTNSKRDQKDRSADSNVSEQNKQRFQLCKARSLAFSKTSDVCMKEIKYLISAGTDLQNIPVYYLESQLEYQLGNYNKAIKLLKAATVTRDPLKYFQDTGDCLPVMFYNNIGCIHFYMGKPKLGKVYIRRAIDEFEKHMLAITNQEHDPDVRNFSSLHLRSLSTRHQLIYNLGMQSMKLRNFDDAFECFMEVLMSYYANPRLWLRIAECCIQIHKPNSGEQFVEYKNEPLISTITGVGPYRKLILNSSTPDKINEDLKHLDIFSVTPSLQFAYICLKNARVLLPKYSVAPAVPHASKTSTQDDNGSYLSDDKHHLSVLPSTFITDSEIISLRNSILAASSYVALCVDDVILAHSCAKSLLSQIHISGAHRYLAHLYAGEALLLMERTPEAVEHFNFEQVNDIELSFPARSSETSLKQEMRFDSKPSEKTDYGSRPVGNISDWFPNTISSARFVSRYNLAVAYSR